MWYTCFRCGTRVSDVVHVFQMWYTMKNTSIAAVDATTAIFSLFTNSANITLDNGRVTSRLTDDVIRYNEVSITRAKYPLYYKKGLGTIACIEYVLDNTDSPYHVLTKRHRKYIRRVTKGKSASTLSYHCKVPSLDKIALVEIDGVIINKYLDAVE